MDRFASEEEIREAVKRYVRAEMDILDKMDFIKEPLPESERYKRRIRRVFRKYGYCPPGFESAPKSRLRVAIAVAAVCVGLFSAVTVGAKILGIHPWEYQSSHIPGIEKEKRVYQELTGDVDPDSVKKRISGEPLYIPEGLKETERIGGEKFLGVVWPADEESGIVYSRYKILEGLSVSIDDESDSEEQIAVAGYIGTYQEQKKEKEKLYRITWDDKDYLNVLEATDYPNAKEELLRMAASMYEE